MATVSCSIKRVVQTLNKVLTVDRILRPGDYHRKVEGIFNCSHLLLVSEYWMRDRLFKTYSNRKERVVLLWSIPLINIGYATLVEYTRLEHRGEWETEARLEGRTRFSELKCAEEEVKPDIKESKLLMPPLGELHSFIYDSDRLKID